MAARSFTPDETTDKAIILITDGENHEDDAIGAAKAAADYQTADNDHDGVGLVVEKFILEEN